MQESPSSDGRRRDDFGLRLRRLWQEGNRRRLVLSRRGETFLRLNLLVAALMALILLWRLPVLTIILVGLLLAMKVQVVVEKTVTPAEPVAPHPPEA